MASASDRAPIEPAAAKVGISSPRFLAFLVAQFLGAVNDNAFKITLILYVLSVVSGEARQIRYSSFATAIFPIPYLLFSPLAGYFADRFRKHRVLLLTKMPEIVAMTLATIGFHLHSIPFLFFVLFFAATQAAFFSPAKYGILPEVFADVDISAANGILELTTDLAILSGSIIGVYVYILFASNLTAAGLVFVAIAILGTTAILFAPRAPAGNRDANFVWNVLSSFRSDFAEVRRNSTLFYSLIGITWFGFLGSFFLTVIPVFGKSELHLSEERVGLLLALLSIGIGMGAVVAGRLSRKHVEIGLVPLGSVGITIFSLLLARSGAGRIAPIVSLPLNTAIELMLLGFSAGFFIIPLNAMLQQRAPAGMKGRIIAFSNVLSFGAVLIAAGVPWLLTSVLGISIRHVILFVAILTLAGTIYVVRMLPDFMVRLLIWIFTNTIYRIHTIGDENLPKEGALLVANHVSWVDAIIVAASTGRMVRFLMFRPYYEWKVLHWFFRMMHVIPVAANDSREKITQSLELARAEIQRGHAVCIFAEGSITRTGNLLKFRRGLERIASGVNCPIVPIYLDGVWGSIFSYDRGRFLFKTPKRLFEPVTVTFGQPMPSNTRADEVRAAIQDLSAQTFAHHKDLQKPLQLGFIRRAKRRWRRTLAIDADGSTITFGAGLTRAIALSQSLWNREAAPGERVGILMPPGIEAMLVNFAALIAGHIPVNIDAVDVSRGAISHAQLTTIVTTHECVEMPGEAEKLSPAAIKYFEDADAASDVRSPLRISAICRLMPTSLIARSFVRGSATDVDQVATILFSYREDAPETPRGAMLTHHNLLSNLESLRQVFHVVREDCILGLIPFSNAMSFAGTLLLPALTGARVAFGAQLLGKPELGVFCRANRVTLIPASPAMVASIIDNVEAADLSRLRHVAVGGGELADDLRERFVKKFGIEPLDGCGCPECAPIISLNVPDYGMGRDRQPGTRRGTAGHPVPGVSVRIVDASTGAPVAQGVEGMLLVSGPNLMKGYVEGPELTRQVMSDGWYITGDRARVDGDGFLTIARRDQAPPQS
jgi:acyl-[acyl-carrier-protein]-phospholipid O-acyltransferase/long-chain-fatty-acid--[acyl-carrier-protein] ligase